MHGFDQPKTKVAGFDLALFKSGAELSGVKAAGEKEANQAAQETAAARATKETADVWTAGVNFFHIYDADSTPGPFSFPVGEASPTLSVNGNRNGLNVYSGYLQGAFLERRPGHPAVQPVRPRAQRRRQSAGQRRRLVCRAGLPVFGAALDPATQPALRPFQRRSQSQRPGQAVLRPALRRQWRSRFRQLDHGRNLRGVHQSEQQPQREDGAFQIDAAARSSRRRGDLLQISTLITRPSSTIRGSPRTMRPTNSISTQSGRRPTGSASPVSSGLPCPAPA